MIVGYIKGQSLSLSSPTIASGTIDHLTAFFTFFTSEWEQCNEIWVHFSQGDTVYDAEIIEGKVNKNQHINLDKGEWEVYLHGNVNVNGEVIERITTEKETLFVKESGIIDGNPFPSVDESTAEKILAKAQYAVNEVERLSAMVEGGIGGGGSSAVTDKPILTISGTRFSGAIRSNVYTVFSNMLERLAVTSLLNVSAENTLPEYVFIFESGLGGFPTRLSLPKEVEWANNDVPEIKVNYKYIIRIFDNVASYSEVEI